MWIQGSMQVKSLSRILSLSLAFEVMRDGFSFSRLLISLSTVIRHVRDILNEAAAGVHTACPSFHPFRLQGYAYDFVWDMSVTYAVVSIQMSGSKRNKQ